MSGYILDIEADNLYLQSTQIWMIHLKSLDGKRQTTIYPYREEPEESKRKYLEWHDSFGEEPLVVSFNGIGYDHWMIWKFLGIPFHIGKQGKDWINFQPCKILDLYIVSQFVDPDRPFHALKTYGEQFGDEKINFHDFSKYSEEMDIYCQQDVNLSIKVYNHLVKTMQFMYQQYYGAEYKKQYQAPLRALQKDYYLYVAQAFTGIEFDQEAARKLCAEIVVEMQLIEDEVLPQLPPRKLKEGEKKFYSMPAKPYKKDGALSTTMEKWLIKHEAKLIDQDEVEAYGVGYKIVPNYLMDIKLPMEIKDGEDIKEWFRKDKLKPEAKEVYTELEWIDD